MGIALAGGYPTVQITNLTGSPISVSTNVCGLPAVILLVSTIGACTNGTAANFTITAPLQGPLWQFSTLNGGWGYTCATNWSGSPVMRARTVNSTATVALEILM